MPVKRCIFALMRTAGRSVLPADNAGAPAVGEHRSTDDDRGSRSGSWSSERRQPIAAAVVAALRASGIILPPSGVIEACRHCRPDRARRHATDALLAGVSDEQIAKLDKLLVVDPSVNMTLFAWLKAMCGSPEGGPHS